MKQETLEKYIGKTWGVLTCIGIDHEDYDIGEIYRTHVDRCSTTIPKGSTSQANGDGSAELLTAA